jgi:hypothetical protein
MSTQFTVETAVHVDSQQVPSQVMLGVEFGVTIHALKVLPSPFMESLDMQLIDGLGFEGFRAKFALDLDTLLVLLVSAEMEAI